LLLLASAVFIAVLGTSSGQATAMLLMVFRILKTWELDPPTGESVVGTVIKILMVVLICYIAYRIVNAAILRRLRAEMPADENEEAEGRRCGRRRRNHHEA
jgi:formate hydrogenlyase subunit 3/multisubunit Na+/H+ antiporter MnhD subunit